MPYMPYFYLLLAIIAEVVGTSALKASDTLTKPAPTVIAIVGYGVAFIFLSLVMRALPVGITYALWSGFGIIFISIAAVFLFGERLDIQAIIGIGLIIAGIIVIQVFSKTNIHS